ncbi:Tfp pilus assembly protein FimT/FimU [Sulfurimonas sp. CS5]|uniref:pilus assembly FimT family protein n=1 Tax=Sulfurimonas sp. CS5 TaxID=3391145 RepID=UPI0039E77716
MLELVFVLVIIGILAAVMLPQMQSTKLREAAIQVVSHIRYTQHLAMVDDKFDKNNTWYKNRWQLKFSNTNGTDNKWAYAIFNDYTNQDGNPNENEIAINPLDKGKRLTGGYSGLIEYGDAKASEKLNLGHSYSVNDIDFTNCGIANDDGKKRVFFDHLGRPLTDNPEQLVNPYSHAGKNLLLTTQCQIELCEVSDCLLAVQDEKITIQIEPETGYVHIID